MNRRIMLALALGILPVAGGALGPELALLMGAKLAVPSLDRAMLWTWANVVFAVPILGLCSFVLFAFRSRLRGAVWRHVFFLPLWAAYVTVGSIIAMVSLHFALARGYDRYQNVLLDSTTYSAKFDDSRFQAITAGTDFAMVEQLLGPPLRQFAVNGDVVLVFSDIGHYRRVAEKAYHQRWVLLRNGKVVRVYRRYLTSDEDPLS